MRIASIAAGLFLAVASLAGAETLAPGLAGDALIEHLRSQFFPHTSLSYRSARQAMFGDLDNVSGFVRLVYTGRAFRTSGIPNANHVNTEHTWPQSKFKHAADKGRMKTDLHHLFPTYNRVNGERGSKPFADIPDSHTQTWWSTPQAEHGVPAHSRDEYSEATQDLFEPREDHKGNVARALAYFYVVYGGQNIDAGWFLDRLETLRRWHEEDPVDQREAERSAGIAQLQGTENPFVLDPGLFARCFFTEAIP